MAQIFQDFGSEVTLIEAQPRLLAEVEPEIAKNLIEILNNDPRLTVAYLCQGAKIKGKPGAMKLSYADADGKSHTLRLLNYVLVATGKRPVLEPLKLDTAGVVAEKARH